MKKKKTLRFYAVLLVIKAMIRVMQMMGRNATHVPGRKAINWCPDFLDQIDKPEYIIGITGTNGKTTTANLIEDALRDNGYDFIDNSFGGNIDSGIASALIKNCTLGGHMKKKMAVLEVDERMTTKIFPYVQPDLLVCTNLFRDSYRRNAHSEFIAGILDKTIPAESRLILNGEDLASNHLAPDNARVCFGIKDMSVYMSETESIINDMTACPKCGTRLVYDYIRYNHIGRAKCPCCGFGSPEIDYAAEKVDLEQGFVTIRTPKGRIGLSLPGMNITDVYNVVTAAAVLMEYGLAPEAVQRSLSKVKIADTRYNEKTISGVSVARIVAKGQNPIACSRVMDYIRHQSGRRAVVLVIDDFYDRQETSENIAWFYDTDYEFLNDPDIVQIVAAGQRCHDNHLRLLMAGIPEERIACCDDDVASAELVDLAGVEHVYILHDIYTTQYAEKIMGRLCARLEKEG